MPGQLVSKGHRGYKGSGWESCQTQWQTWRLPQDLVCANKPMWLIKSCSSTKEEATLMRTIISICTLHWPAKLLPNVVCGSQCGQPR